MAEFDFFKNLSGSDFDRTNLGNYGTFDYTAPVAPREVNVPSGLETIDLTSAPISNIKPYLPIIPQGEGRDDIFESYRLYNDKKDPNYIRGMEPQNKNWLAELFKGIASIPKMYMEYGPMGQAKKGFEYLKEKDRVAKENQRLADLVQERTRQNEIDIIQRGLDDDPRGTGKGISSMLETQYSVHANENETNNAAARAAAQAAINERAASVRESFRGNQGGGGGGARGTSSSQPGGNVGGLGGHGPARWKEGGRIRYGEGGIVTL